MSAQHTQSDRATRGSRARPTFARAANAVVAALAVAAYLSVVGCAVARGPTTTETAGISGEVQAPPENGAGTEQAAGEARAEAAGEALAGTESLNMPTLSRGLNNPFLEFIVRFEDGEGAEVIERFRQDPDQARLEWQAFAANNAAFRGLRLKRAGYRGECTLEWIGPVPPVAEAANELSQEIVERLSNAPGVAYAEPNLGAWRGSVEQ